MTWTAPPPPLVSLESKIAYWRCILDIPDDEPGAGILQEMAAERLVDLVGLRESRSRLYAHTPEVAQLN